MVVGREYVVAVFLDSATGRVAAASSLAQFFDYDVSRVKVDSVVSLLVYGTTPRGIQVIVDDRYSGLVYSSETFTPLDIGKHLEGYVAKIRDDNKLDIRLQRTGAQGQKDAASVILDALSQAGGVLSLGDRRPAELIYAELGLSTKVFQAAVGGLYKAGKVVPGPGETHLKK
jgi:predicted RNA-binding protein (virulence factor B family)